MWKFIENYRADAEIPRNSSLILEEKENLKKILEEKKIPRFRPLIEITGIRRFDSIGLQPPLL